MVQRSQGFPQVLRTWEGLDVNTEEEHGGGAYNNGENTCEGVHLLVKLLAINLQVCKFTKNELLHAYFSRISARF